MEAMRKGPWRVVMVMTSLVAVGFAISLSAPAYVVAIVAIVAAALIAWAVQRFAP